MITCPICGNSHIKSVTLFRAESQIFSFLSIFCRATIKFIKLNKNSHKINNYAKRLDFYGALMNVVDLAQQSINVTREIYMGYHISDVL